MVELPRVPRRMALTEGARTAVTAADIASPYASLSRALTSVEGTVEAFGEEYAKEQGAKAVTKDADGNLQVQTMPMFSGKSGHAYNRVARTSYLARVDDEMDLKFKEKALEFQDKPQEFAEWGKQYADSLVGKQTDDALAGAVRIAADRKLGEHTRSLMLRSHNLSQKRSQEAMDAKLIQTGNDLESIALAEGVDTPGFKSRMDDFNALLDEKVNNPAIAYPREKADLLRDKVMTQTFGAVVLNKVEKIYNDRSVDPEGNPLGGYEAARKYVREAARELGGTVKETAKIEREANAWINSEQRANAGERAAVRAEIRAAMPLIDTMSPEQLDAIQERGFAAGAYREAAELQMQRIARGAARDIYNLPPAERAEVLRSGKLPGARAAPAGTASQVEALTGTANRLGINPRDLAAAISYETGGRFDPNIVGGKGNNYMGLIQFGPAEREKYGVKPGMTIEQQMGAVENFLRDRGVKPGMGISEIYRTINGGNPNAPLTASDGNATIGEHIERIKAGHYGNADKFLTGTATGGPPPVGGAPAGTATTTGEGGIDLTKSRTGLLTLGIMRKEMQADLGRRITQFQEATNKDGILNPADVTALAAEVNAVGTPEQKKNVLELAKLAEASQAFAQLPEDEREAYLAALKNKPDASAFDRRASDYLEKAHNRITAQYQKDPYAAHAFINRQPIGLVDFTNPQAATQVVGQRVVDQQNMLTNGQITQPVSVLRPGEAKATAQLLTQGNAALATNTLNTIAKLPPDQAAATLSDPVIRDAVVSMSRSSDPNRMNPAMSVLDQQWQRDPAAYNKNFPGTINSLQTWQTFKDSSTPEELTKNMRVANDPSQSAARKAAETEASNELKSIKSSQIVSAFDTSFFRLPAIQGPFAPIDTPGVSNVVPTAADVDPLQSGRLTAEFEEHYKELRKSAVPAEEAVKKAVERLKINWKPSETNGNALTRHAPELYYPDVDGSHSYIRQQIETNIDFLYGRDKAPDPFSDTPPGVREYSFVATVADKQTEAEVSAKRPPSYQIVVRNDRTGRLELMFNPETGQTRWGFDPQPARDEAARRLYETPRAALERQQQALEKSGLGGAFREAQQRRIDTERARLDRERPVNPNQPKVAGAQSIDESGY